MTLIEVLNGFDAIDKKRFYAHDVTSELKQLPDEEKHAPQFRYEGIAFSLVANGNETEWGTYYGPMFTGKKADGSPASYPELTDIENDTVLYWETRAQQATNPLLKARYCGLVWDFKKRVCNDSYPNWLFDTYIQSLLDVANGDYEPHDVITVNVLERLSNLAGNNPKYVEQVKAAFVRFDNERTGDDNAARLWGALLGFIIRHKGAFTAKEEATLTNKHEARLKRLSREGNSNPWAAKEQATILADYYKSRQKDDDVKRVLNVMEGAFRSNKKNMSPMQWMGNLEQIAGEYATYGLQEERLRLMKEIEVAGNNALSEMTPKQFTFEYPKEALEQLNKMLTEGSFDEQYEKFILYFTPNLQEESKQLKILSERYPFAYMMSTQLMDSQGRPSSVIGGIDTDFEGQLILHISKGIQLKSIPLNSAIRALQESGTLKIAYLMNRAEKCPIIDNSRLEIIRQSMIMYEAGNFITMCHLLVPQIEDAFRKLVDLSGEAIIRPMANRNKKVGYTQRILDDILRDDVVRETFGEDMAFYFRLLLTDQRGMNIRNNLCHGLVDPSFFNYLVADRLLHLFCCITLVAYK